MASMALFAGSIRFRAVIDVRLRAQD
ncbi:MAG: hypothetical protein QOI46_2633, partial [Alphaproteobacteria bacterium]|nr:hypothetical protein [Alphaproteobacteria bacterium]